MGSLRVRYQYTAGYSLSVSIERLLDGLNYDFADSTFKSTTITTLTSAMTADPLRSGIYRFTLANLATAQFTNGDYAVYIHSAGIAIDGLGAKIYNGDDATVFPSAAGADPLAVDLTGYNTPNTLGYNGKRLDAAVSSRALAGDAMTLTTAERTAVADVVDTVLTANHPGDWAATGGSEDPYVQAYCYGDMSPLQPDGSFFIYDVNNKTLKRLQYSPQVGWGRIMTKDPA